MRRRRVLAPAGLQHDAGGLPDIEITGAALEQAFVQLTGGDDVDETSA